jgi:hypothetical protein
MHGQLGQLVIRQAMLLPREKGAARARTAFGVRSIIEQNGFAAGPASRSACAKSARDAVTD